MRFNFFAITLLVLCSFGFLHIPESFSEDYFATPSCNKGVYSNDHIQCSTDDLPPCPEPSFEKNGYCAVKKIDICGTGHILRDGLCMEESEFYESNARQSLITGKPMGDAPNTFGWFALVLSAFIVFAYAAMKIKMRKNRK